MVLRKRSSVSIVPAQAAISPGAWPLPAKFSGNPLLRPIVGGQ
jgi:hypothetical protein